MDWMLAAMVALIALAVIAGPLCRKQQDESFLIDESETDPHKLWELKERLLERYLNEEAAYWAGDLTKREWRKRQSFLMYRYMDIAHKLDLRGFALSTEQA